MNKLLSRLCVLGACVILGVAAIPNEVKAEEAGLKTVDLVIFAGQSNMAGGGGDAGSAPAVPKDQGYEFRYGKCPTGLYNITEPFGIYQNGFLSDPDGIRKGSLVSAFSNTYFKSTGVPVLAFSATRSGSPISYWQAAPVQAELIQKFDLVNAWCQSNHVNIRRRYLVWLQGETDAMTGMNTATYEANLASVFNPLFNRGLEQVFIITIGQAAGVPCAYDNIANAQLHLCQTDPRFSLGTDVLRSLPAAYTPDTIHYNQSALNTAGSQAASVAALFTKTVPSMTIAPTVSAATAKAKLSTPAASTVAGTSTTATTVTSTTPATTTVTTTAAPAATTSSSPAPEASSEPSPSPEASTSSGSNGLPTAPTMTIPEAAPVLSQDPVQPTIPVR